jgi:predicted  nucleic acid-binding Zn-ribbon protein
MSEIERHSLDAHVSICELRYQALNDRLDHMTQDMDELKTMIKGLARDLDRQQDNSMNHWHRAQWAVIGVLLSSLGWAASRLFG